MSYAYKGLSNKASLNTGSYDIDPGLGNNGDILELNTTTGQLELVPNGGSGANFLVATDNLFIPNTLSAGGAGIQKNTIISPYPATYALTTADECTFVGYECGKSNNTGTNNSAYGTYSLATNQDGSTNVAYGRASLFKNISGSANTAMGVSALYNSTSDYNTAIGGGSGVSCTGQENFFGGFQAGNTGVGCNYCTAVGSQADITASATNQIALGYLATTTVDNSCQIGNSSVNLLKLGSTNVLNLSKGTDSQFVGCDYTGTITSGCLRNQVQNGITNSTPTAITETDYIDNTIYGYNSGSALSTGSYNTIYGNLAGKVIAAGTGNIYMGYDISASSSSVNNEIVIAGGTDSKTGAGANSCQIGNSSVNLLKIGSNLILKRPSGVTNSTSLIIGNNVTESITGAENLLIAGGNISTYGVAGSVNSTVIGTFLAASAGGLGNSGSGPTFNSNSCVLIGNKCCPTTGNMGSNSCINNTFIGASSGLSGSGVTSCTSNTCIGHTAIINASTITNAISLGYNTSNNVSNSCNIGNSSVNLLKLGASNLATLSTNDIILGASGTTSISPVDTSVCSLGASTRPFNELFLNGTNTAISSSANVVAMGSKNCALVKLVMTNGSLTNESFTINTTNIKANNSLVFLQWMFVSGPAKPDIFLRYYGIVDGVSFTINVKSIDGVSTLSIGDEYYVSVLIIQAGA